MTATTQDQTGRADDKVITAPTAGATMADNVLRERTEEYSNAHLVTGAILDVTYPHEALLAHSGFRHNWNMIMGKMIRVLFNPFGVDHWIDIRNFAQLVVEELTKEQPSKSGQEPPK